MQRVKLANVILESEKRAFEAPALYCRSTAPIFCDILEKTWKLQGPGEYDFMTYFNGLSLKKWNTYTNIKTVHLCFDYKGFTGTICLTRSDPFAVRTIDIPETTIDLPVSEDWQHYDITFPDLDAEIVSFRVEVNGEGYIKQSYYYAEVEEEDIHEVELALVCTTFKKEDYVSANVSALEKNILRSDELIAEHFTIHIVDNGRTLVSDQFTQKSIYVHPNKNVGGAGGFTRGMIEAMRQKPKVSHVLLMDDDVSVSSESIIRTFNLLTLVKEEFNTAFIAGAMLNLEVCDELWEELSTVEENGMLKPVRGGMRMNVLTQMITKEEYRYDEKKDVYAAWWFCCIPTEVIERNGLPLPLFVRNDDVEYSLRCRPKFLTMNGICVWHEPFHSRYNPAVERYQSVRNEFIMQATTGVASRIDFMRHFTDIVRLELKKFNYDNAELALDGFADFLKGPDFISQDLGEKLFIENGKKAEKLVPLSELNKELKIDISTLTRCDIEEDEPRRLIERMIDFFSFNGQRLPDRFLNDEIGIIFYEGWFYQAKKMRLKKQLLAIDVNRHQGVLRVMDKKRFREVWHRYKKLVREYKKRKNEIDEAYQAARAKLISLDFWKEYLEIE